MENFGNKFYNYRQRVGTLQDTNLVSKPIVFESVRSSPILNDGAQWFITVSNFRISNGAIPIMRNYPEQDDRHITYGCQLRYNGDSYYFDNTPLDEPSTYFYNYDNINNFFEFLIVGTWLIMQNDNQPTFDNTKDPRIFRGANDATFLQLDQSIYTENVKLDITPSFYLKYGFSRDDPTPFTFKEDFITIKDPDAKPYSRYSDFFSNDDNRKYQDEFRSLIIQTSGIPIAGESLSFGNASVNILSDFTPAQQIGRQDVYIYKPFGRRRSYQLLTTTNLKELDATLRWTSTLDINNTNILYSPPNSVNTLRFEFSRRPAEMD
jgi:hypothetical protein